MISGSGFKLHNEGVRFQHYNLIFHKFPHETEIFWFKSGGSCKSHEPLLNLPLTLQFINHKRQHSGFHITLKTNDGG